MLVLWFSFFFSSLARYSVGSTYFVTSVLLIRLVFNLSVPRLASRIIFVTYYISISKCRKRIGNTRHVTTHEQTWNTIFLISGFHPSNYIYQKKKEKKKKRKKKNTDLHKNPPPRCVSPENPLSQVQLYTIYFLISGPAQASAYF